MSGIASEAEGLRADLQAALDSVPAYSSARSNATLTVGAGIKLARMIRDLARLIEEKP